MKIVILFCAILLSSITHAKGISMGSIAENISEPLDVVSGFIAVGCLLVGVARLFAAIVKYFEHRRSPLAVPISVVVWLIIIAFLLLLLPFAYLLTGEGVPLSVIWGG